jgi:hypothetical protein
MHEEQQGGLSRVSLSQIANADRVRQEQQARRTATTRRRHGNKGARRWGYATPGSGKRS